MARVIEIKAWALYHKSKRTMLRGPSRVPVTFATKLEAVRCSGSSQVWLPRRVKVAVSWQGR